MSRTGKRIDLHWVSRRDSLPKGREEHYNVAESSFMNGWVSHFRIVRNHRTPEIEVYAPIRWIGGLESAHRPAVVARFEVVISGLGISFFAGIARPSALVVQRADYP